MNDYGLIVVSSPGDKSIKLAHSEAVKLMPEQVSSIDFETNSFEISGKTDRDVVAPPFLWVNRNVFKGWCKRMNKEDSSLLLRVDEINTNKSD